MLLRRSEGERVKRSMPIAGLAVLPPFAAWRFVDAVDGFEVVYLEPGRFRGHTSAVEDGRAYAVSYEISLDEGWITREVRVTSDTVDGRAEHAPALGRSGQLDRRRRPGAAPGRARRRRPRGVGLHQHAARPPADDARRRGRRRVRRVRPGRRSRGAPARPDVPSASTTTASRTRRRAGSRRCSTYDDAGLVVDYPGIAVRFA